MKQFAIRLLKVNMHLSRRNRIIKLCTAFQKVFFSPILLSRTNINPLKPNDLYRRRAVSPLKIEIPSKNMREKPTNAPIIHSV
jgi:hypothetical protein